MTEQSATHETISFHLLVLPHLPEADQALRRRCRQPTGIGQGGVEALAGSRSMKFGEWRDARPHHSAPIVKEILPRNSRFALSGSPNGALPPRSTLATADGNAIFGRSVMDTS